VVEGDEFLSLSSEQVIKLISSDKLIIPSEEKVGKIKLIFVIPTLVLDKTFLSHLPIYKYNII